MGRQFTYYSRDDLIRVLQDYEKALAGNEDERTRLLYELPLHQVELEMQNRELVEAQHAIEIARDRYSDLYDFAPVGYLSLEKNGVIQNINLTGCAMLGRDRAALLGVPFTTFLAAGQRRSFFALMKRLFVSRESESGDFRLADAEHRVIQVECRVHSEPEGEPTCLAVLTDITRRKLAEAELRRERSFLQHLIDGIEDPILVVAPDYRVLRMNRAAKNLVDGSPDADAERGLACHRIVHRREQPCEGPTNPCPLQAVLQTRRSTKVIHEQVMASGVTRRFEVSLSPLQNDDGDVLGVIEVYRDITDQAVSLR